MKFPSTSDLYSLFLKHPVVSTDSRTTPRGSIFFALKGENFDGNTFAEPVLKQGCSYAVIDNETYYKEGTYVLVKDSLSALQDLAAHHRSQLKIPVVAITGSNGKTTTKELLKAVLSKKYKVLATTGNLNNHIGVPLTVLSITPDIEMAVIEMGANHMGEIAALCRIAQPDYGLITNIGRAHIGEFGSFENIVKAKTEMYDFIRGKKGKVFVSSGNELLMDRSKGIERITFGPDAEAGCRCFFDGADPVLKAKHDNESIRSQLIGKYNFENVSAAIAIGKYFGVENKKIKEAIEEYVPSNNRSQVVKTKFHTLILDAYNANPSSMQVAIDNFSEMEGEPKWLILGDMLELGPYEDQEHQEILHTVESMKFQNVILVGERFLKAAKEKKGYLVFKTSDELSAKLRLNSPIENGSWILIKGSRGMKLEKAVEFL